jgi:3-oxoacyl-[acyl-carrier protein] reductase
MESRPSPALAQHQKVALVTGASRGLGAAIARRLSADGFAVVVNYAGNAKSADEVVAEIKGKNGQAIAVQADIDDEDDVEGLFASALRTFGRLDVVVNNAGILPLRSIEEGNVAEFDGVIRTNLRGTFLVLSQAARHLREGGRIIALSTSVIPKALPNYGPYIASKAGVEGLVHVLANELRGRGITVNAVAPGPIPTDLFLNGKSPAQLEQLSKAAPLERFGTPEEIAGVVSLLAGPDGSWINSQVIRVNGGMV